MVCVPSCATTESAKFPQKMESPPYPRPAHAEALVEPEQPFVDHNLPDAVERSLVLVRLVVHQPYFHHICAQASEHHDLGRISERWSYSPTGFDVTEQKNLCIVEVSLSIALWFPRTAHPANVLATKCKGTPSCMTPRFFSDCLIWSYEHIWVAERTIPRMVVASTPRYSACKPPDIGEAPAATALCAPSCHIDANACRMFR